MDGVFSLPHSLGTMLSSWWTRRLFPGRGETANQPRSLPALPAFALLLTLSTLLFFTQLQIPLLEPQEPRYAEISREMLAERSWVVPVLHSQPYLDKPPMFYWLIMASYQVFGVQDWAARLVPGLAGVLTVLLTWLWGKAVVGERSAFWGALILCLSARFVYLERLLTFDSVLCLTVTAGLAAAHVAVLGTQLRWGWWALSAAACGLGLLTKGPVAMALILLPAFLYQSIDGRCPRPTLTALAVYLAVAGLVAAPWFVSVLVLQPDFAGYFFWTHNVVRFLAPFDHEEPFWFHLPGLLFGMLPWSLLLPGLLLFLLRKSPQNAARRSPALGFFLLAGLWGLLFFSLAGCKRAVYILPTMPPLALAFGYYLGQLLSCFPQRAGSGVLSTEHSVLSTQYSLPANGGKGRKVALAPCWPMQQQRLPGVASFILLLLALSAVAIAGKNQLVSPTSTLFFCLTLAGLLSFLWFANLRSWPVCAGLTFGLLFAALHLIMPGYSRQFSLREQLQAHRLDTVERQLICCYPQCWESAEFYRPDAEVKVFSAGEEALLLQELTGHPGVLLLVRAGRWEKELVRQLPKSLEYVAGQSQGNVTVGWVKTRQDGATRNPKCGLRVAGCAGIVSLND